ncbi:MAG: hypothetical protein OJJ54_07030 [Pseudonocardia sp.]|nr:hypothetical protein [Pseudonocardia sp.]
MSHDDVDTLAILEKVPHLADAQIWEIARRHRIYRSRPDGEDQTVEVELSVDTAGRWMVVATDAERGLTAQGVPMPGLNGAINMVPWYMLDDPAAAAADRA